MAFASILLRSTQPAELATAGPFILADFNGAEYDGETRAPAGRTTRRPQAITASADTAPDRPSGSA